MGRSLRGVIPLALGLAAVVVTVGAASSVKAESPFGVLTGTWSGAGQVRFTGGSSEALKCRAYYTPKDATNMGLAIRCASTSAKIELRANLAYDGGKVTGSWEERTFNASGNVTGQATASKLNLAIQGGGFSGSMAVGINGGSQTVSIQTQGTGFTNVNIHMSKG
jgi:hypothetical protein